MPLFPDLYLQNRYRGRPASLAQIVTWYIARLWQLRRAKHYDLVWVSTEILPWLPAFPERWLARFGPPYVVEYDDAVFHRYDGHRSRFVRTVLGRKLDLVMALAATVIVGNEYLGDRAIRAGARRIALLPSVVDLDAYPEGPSNSAAFTVGWIGSPTTTHYLKLIEGPLRALHARGARLVAVGASTDALGTLPVEIRPWSQETEGQEISTFDVGIMPLVDGPWERGKCGYKLIQYMACGRPVVASPVGVNRVIVEHGSTGFLAETDRNWTSAFETLETDPARRDQLGAAARRLVEQQYSLQVTVPKLAGILRVATEPPI